MHQRPFDGIDVHRDLHQNMNFQQKTPLTVIIPSVPSEQASRRYLPLNSSKYAYDLETKQQR